MLLDDEEVVYEEVEEYFQEEHEEIVEEINENIQELYESGGEEEVIDELQDTLEDLRDANSREEVIEILEDLADELKEEVLDNNGGNQNSYRYSNSTTSLKIRKTSTQSSNNGEIKVNTGTLKIIGIIVSIIIVFGLIIGVGSASNKPTEDRSKKESSSKEKKKKESKFKEGVLQDVWYSDDEEHVLQVLSTINEENIKEINPKELFIMCNYRNEKIEKKLVEVILLTDYKDRLEGFNEITTSFNASRLDYINDKKLRIIEFTMNNELIKIANIVESPGISINELAEEYVYRGGAKDIFIKVAGNIGNDELAKIIVEAGKAVLEKKEWLSEYRREVSNLDITFKGDLKDENELLCEISDQYVAIRKCNEMNNSEKDPKRKEALAEEIKAHKERINELKKSL